MSKSAEKALSRLRAVNTTIDAYKARIDHFQVELKQVRTPPPFEVPCNLVDPHFIKRSVESV